MSTAPLDSGSFDKKLQDPWVLLLRPSFSCGRNCRTLVQSNSVLPFFDKKFKKATQKYTPLFGILRPLVTLMRNCRTLIQGNSVLLFSDGAFQFHNFSINASCIFCFQRTALTSIFFSFVVTT